MGEQLCFFVVHNAPNLAGRALFPPHGLQDVRPALRSAHDHGTNLLFPHVIKTVVDCGFPGRRCGIDRLLRIQGFQ